jgi:signal transduction histidine kinase
MMLKIQHIATRFALILAFAAALPLVAYGIWSLVSLQTTTRQSVVAGNQNVATRAAEEIRRYISTNAEILKTLGADLENTGLLPWQQDRILKNYVLQFREFREITLFDESGATIATSRIGRPHVALLDSPAASFDGVAMSAMHVDQDLLPTSLFAVHLTRLNQPAGWLIGEFSLEQMWRMVDEIRIGSHGFALVAAPDGKLIAHGDPDKKALIAQSANIAGRHPLVGAVPEGPSASPAWREYVDRDGVEQLAVAAPIPQLGWTVIVEQPTREAYGSALVLRRQLIVAISTALLVMVGLGLLFGRRFIAPIFTLQRATQSIAEGNLETRVEIPTVDEFGKLGDAFNAMASRLIELQEDVKRQERQAMFGRIVGGLFHDLSHPVQNVGNHAQLLIRADSDQETREISTRAIQREVATLKRFMDDFRNVSKPRPVERFAVEVNGSVAEIVESMRPEADRAGVDLEAEYAAAPLTIEGDRFALGRVYRNLITNAIQATPSGGRVSVGTRRAGDHVEIEVTDTGSGIAPERLLTIFDTFVTTKRRGLGLGLAISKQIVEQLDGTIAVRSEVGRGTSFTLRFPARDDRSAQEAAS